MYPHGFAPRSKRGAGDALEISGGLVTYHVGPCDDEDVLSAASRALLAQRGHAWGATLRKQPPGVPADGYHFTWQPADGEVFAAGPRAARPFHIYASSDGPLREGPPYSEN